VYIFSILVLSVAAILARVVIALLGLFYPHFVFIAAIILILRLLGWDRGYPVVSESMSSALQD